MTIGSIRSPTPELPGSLPTVPTRRDAALSLAEELLADIELSRMPPPDIVRKASRLARLVDEVSAVEWLGYEIRGYPAGPLDASASAAAWRSNRLSSSDANGVRYWTTSLPRLQAEVEAGLMQLQAAGDPNVSLTSANPNQWLTMPTGNSAERSSVRNIVADRRELIGKIVGAVHSYVSTVELELRFGAVAESAFAALRDVVDTQIAALAPSAATKLAAAFENLASGNPEHWANAASECRRLLKAIADELRPPGPPVDGRDMTDDKYINRLIDWISHSTALGGTLQDVIVTDLEDFGKRIDAFDGAGHKGAHAEVTRYEASRFIAGTYLLLGDILNLAQPARLLVPDEPIVHAEVPAGSASSTPEDVTEQLGVASSSVPRRRRRGRSAGGGRAIRGDDSPQSSDV